MSVLGTRGKTRTCDYKGQKRGDPGGRGKGHRSPLGFWLGGSARAKSQATGVRAGAQRTGQRSHPYSFTDSEAEGPELSPVCRRDSLGLS